VKPATVVGEHAGLRVVAYAGDQKILLAMSLADGLVGPGERNLAGFAVWRGVAGKPEQPLANRLSFQTGVHEGTTPEEHVWTPSDQAPFQKFRWVDVPPDGFTGPITYRVRALYFAGQGQALKDGPEVSVQVTPAEAQHAKFRPAFTRGYIASQAYADRFHNADIRPAGKKRPDFDTAPFAAQYAWLGADARTALFDFLADCERHAGARVDLFAYDLDEPDVIAAVCRIGKQGRLRAILDNAPLHTKPGAVEIQAAKLIAAAAGAGNVLRGHFDRFQHNKVLIRRDGASGTATRVLFGSMNFSVRGLYVQGNNVMVVDDPGIAGMFGAAFDAAWKGKVQAGPFRRDPVARGYMVGSPTDGPDLPKCRLALSPHADAAVSLGPMAERIRAAASSVLFAVMAPSGGGPVLASLRAIAGEPTVFSYGTVETDEGLAVQRPNGQMGAVTGFAALAKNVPWPFVKEVTGGSGLHIHDKFVVVDFNDARPAVYTGSSNLAEGGEQANGDSLIEIEDDAIANMFAIEAVALFDHYHFRDARRKATEAQPLTLWHPGKVGMPRAWWQDYYDLTSIHLRDRCLFAQVPLPAGVAPVKTVDWSSLDAAGAKPAKARRAEGPR
jgi:hypothetical protein